MVDQRMPLEALTGGAPIHGVDPQVAPGGPEEEDDDEGMMELIELLLQIPEIREMIRAEMMAIGEAEQGMDPMMGGMPF